MKKKSRSQAAKPQPKQRIPFSWMVRPFSVESLDYQSDLQNTAKCVELALARMNGRESVSTQQQENFRDLSAVSSAFARLSRRAKEGDKEAVHFVGILAIEITAEFRALAAANPTAFRETFAEMPTMPIFFNPTKDNRRRALELWKSLGAGTRNLLKYDALTHFKTDDAHRLVCSLNDYVAGVVCALRVRSERVGDVSKTPFREVPPWAKRAIDLGSLSDSNHAEWAEVMIGALRESYPQFHSVPKLAAIVTAPSLKRKPYLIENGICQKIRERVEQMARNAASNM